MSKIFTYIRNNENNQKYTLEQRASVENYLVKNNITNFKNIEININTPSEEKNILELLKNCEMNSTIIVSNLNVFGRTIETILEIVKFLLANQIRIILVEQSLDLLDDKDMLTQMILSVITMTVSLEKELMSLRTKEALRAKKLNGMSLGKPKGTIQKSKFCSTIIILILFDNKNLTISKIVSIVLPKTFKFETIIVEFISQFFNNSSIFFSSRGVFIIISIFL